MKLAEQKLIEILPYFRPKIWGGTRLKKFNFKIPNNKKIGEAWLVSAIKDCSSYVPDYKMNLEKLWNNNPNNIFGSKSSQNKFPLLIKILDANDDLSVQVHPNNSIAQKEHGCFGKAEAWYVLETPNNKNSEIVYGHKNENLDTLSKYIDKNEWNNILKKVKIKKNDFVYIPPGKIHSLTSGAMVLEVQQSSDITYRLYDFDRKDDNGKLRDLHIDQSKAVIDFPDIDFPIKNIKNGILIDNLFFTSEIFTTKLLSKTIDLPSKTWFLISIISGKGLINNQAVKKGQSFLIPYTNNSEKLSITKGLKVILNYQNKNNS